jgi:hypothetical protein
MFVAEADIYTYGFVLNNYMYIDAKGRYLIRVVRQDIMSID